MLDILPQLDDAGEDREPVNLLARLRVPIPTGSVSDDVWPLPAEKTLPEPGWLDDLAVLEEHYETGVPSAVQAMLRARPRTAIALRELPAQVERVFGPHVELRLESFQDLDDTGEPSLVVIIDPPLPRREARGQLRTLDREWWLARKRSLGSGIFLSLP